MGLDMYLTASKWQHGYAHGTEQERETFTNLINAIGAQDFYDKDSPMVTVEFNIGYWRKANAIHGWFVEHVQDGEDNCNKYYVNKDQLRALQEACLTALADRSEAPKLLPPTEGFFFGGYELDEWYWECLKETVVVIGRALRLPDEWQIHYQSSW